MTSSIHFRFKSARQFENLTFEGDFMKVADLKLAIVERKKLNFGEGFDLEISDAATGDVFQDENSLIPKNTSVIVRRIPGLKPGGILSHQDMAGKNERYAEKTSTEATNGITAVDEHAQEMPKTIEGADEADRIASLISQSNNAIDMFPPPPPRGRYGQRGSFRGARGGRGGRGGRGTRGYGASGFNSQGNAQAGAFGNTNSGNMYPERAPRPSANYVCHRCNQPGHWIDQCPTNGDPTYDKIKVRAPTGIPRSMLRQVDAPESGTGLQDSSGHFVTLQPNEEEFARQTVGLRLSQAAAEATTKKEGDSNPPDKSEVPTLSPEQAEKSEPADENVNSEKPVDSTKEGLQANQNNPNEAGPTLNSDELQKKTDDPTIKGNSAIPLASKGGNVRPENNQMPVERGSNSRVNKPAGRPSAHGGPPRQSGRMPPPGMPMPSGHPGFPSMAMPPFPPGMPPPPPHILMAMAAAASGQQGLHPMPPGFIPPNLPFPFPPPGSESNPPSMPNDTAQDQGFQQFMHMAQSQSKAQRDGNVNQDELKDKEGRFSDKPRNAVRNRDKRPSAENNDSSISSPRPKENGSGDVDEQNAGRGLDHSGSERIESPDNSKTGPEPLDKPDVRRENSRSRRFSYENDRDISNDERHMHDSKLSRHSKSQHLSPREQSTSPQRRSPAADRFHSPPPRRDRAFRHERYREADPYTRDDRNGDHRNRDRRRGRSRDISPPAMNGSENAYPRKRSLSRERHRRSPRKRSPSLPRGYRESNLRSSRGRDVSSPRQHRYPEHRDRARVSPPRGRRERRRSRSFSPRARHEYREYRYRPSSPRAGLRFESSRYRRDEARSRQLDHPREPQSPNTRDEERVNGLKRHTLDKGESQHMEEDVNGAKVPQSDRPNDQDQLKSIGDGNAAERRFDAPPAEANINAEGKDGLRAKNEMEEQTQRQEKVRDVEIEIDKGRDREWDRDRSRYRDRERDKYRSEERSRRAREYSIDEARPSKRSRRERSLERMDMSRREHKDRRSVHDRLGHPRREGRGGREGREGRDRKDGREVREGRRGRRSVHDRLG